MKRTVLFIVLLTALCAHGQVLYKVSGNSAKAPSYIFATNKIVGIEFLDSVPSLLHCFSQCSIVLTEFAMQDYEALAALRVAALLPDSIRLDRYYTDDEYKQIDEAMQLTLGMGMDKLCRMKPSYLTAMYRNELLHKWLDYDDQRSMEAFFQSLAADKNMPVRAIDEIGETMYMIFDREPFHWQCKQLLQIIEYPEREVRQERTLAEMYRMGRLTDMSYQILSPDNQSTQSYSDYQIYAARNKEWVKRLRPYLVNGGAFITLDAIYLGGEKGLLAELRAAGYRVKSVNK
ncbi:MAG: TraB/GumN family protein [Paludibacteraceae bacterium]|nr:TraB/GumN family protein [Paludibacteraceae bacterium]